MRLRPFALLASVLVVLGVAGSATASTGGTPDGIAHSNVGLILAYSDDGNRYRCSATLVSQTVLLTAAHCTDGVVGQVLVTFDSEIADQAPPPFPAAADPAAGYTETEIAQAGYLSGVAHVHPQYSDLTDRDNWNDVG